MIATFRNFLLLWRLKNHIMRIYYHAAQTETQYTFSKVSSVFLTSNNCYITIPNGKPSLLDLLVKILSGCLTFQHYDEEMNRRIEIFFWFSWRFCKHWIVTIIIIIILNDYNPSWLLIWNGEVCEYIFFIRDIIFWIKKNKKQRSADIVLSWSLTEGN